MYGACLAMLESTTVHSATRRKKEEKKEKKSATKALLLGAANAPLKLAPPQRNVDYS